MKANRATSKAKPLKRPTQARAKVTVQAVFDAFVRIWQRDGWQRLTTRAVALETGIAVGTLYEYFPNKEAILSGYVRYCIETLVHNVEVKAIEPPDLGWETRIERLVHLMSGADTDGMPWFHREMLELETTVAEPKHQRRAYEELAALWPRVLDACTDLPHRPSPETVEALHLAVWGGRRYAKLVGLDQEKTRQWAEQMERLCRQAILQSAD